MTWWPKMPSSSRKHWRSKERPCSERRVRPGRLASFSTALSATRAALPSYRSSRRRRLHSPLMYFEMTPLLREYTDTPLAAGCRGDGGTEEDESADSQGAPSQSLDTGRSIPAAVDLRLVEETREMTLIEIAVPFTEEERPAQQIRTARVWS